MMRTLLAPRWIAGHVLVVLVIPLFVALGFWQLSRHEERAAFNSAVEQGMRAPQRPLAALGPLGEEDFYRPVSVEGVWAPDEELLLTPRSLRGSPGHHVLTPLLLDDGRALLVDRGWVPYDRRPPVTDAAPPTGRVEVSGLLMPGERSGSFGVNVPEQGRAELISVVDVERIGQQVAAPLVPAWVLGTGLANDSATLPVPPEPPELDAGPHLSYAVQWFLFAAVVVVGYPILLRRTLRTAEPAAGIADAADRSRVT